MNTPILLYHSIANDSARLQPPWAISSSEFERHIDYLCQRGYQPVTLKNIADARSGRGMLPEHPVAVTFDDGMADFVSDAMPILKKYDFTVTLYVPTGYVGSTCLWLPEKEEQDRMMLSWEQIATLEGVELGAHGHSHLQMDLIPPSQARDEIMKSRALLEHHSGRSIDTFSFPYGYYTNRLLDIVREAGFSSACIVRHVMADDADDVFALPRIMITSRVTTRVLAQYLQGIGLRRRSAWMSFLRKGWRITRLLKRGMESWRTLSQSDDRT